MKQEQLYEKVKAIIFGHAVGDAVGGPVQFEERPERDRFPVTDMMPFHGYCFPKGTWSDDTSMSLCTMDALTKRGLDLRAVMGNFKKWLYKNEFTPTGVAFDVGQACYRSIQQAGAIFEAEKMGCCGERENGNGSLMRIYPFTLFLHCSDFPLDGKIAYIHRASALTHAHPRSCMGCGIYSFVLWELLENPTKQGIGEGLKKAEEYYREEPESKHYHRLFDAGFSALPRDEIESSGYVVDTLEAAVWCVLTTENYRDCILKAVNLGLDTDSVGAVAGSLAGLLYGFDGIPEDWRNSLLKKEYIEEIGQEFCDMLCGSVPRNEYKRHRSFMLVPDPDFRIWQIYSWEHDFFLLCEDFPKGAQSPLYCNGFSPESWHKIEECPFKNPNEKIVIFEYKQHFHVYNSYGLAFTTYRNYRKFLRSVPDKDEDDEGAFFPLWDPTAIYKIPDFDVRMRMCPDASVARYTFREVRDYLVEKFGFATDSLVAWSGDAEREYTLGSFARITGPMGFRKVLRKQK